MRAIEKAIQQLRPRAQPEQRRHVIRLAFPPLTAERRKELVKVVKHMAEEGRVAVRNLRRARPPRPRGAREGRRHLRGRARSGPRRSSTSSPTPGGRDRRGARAQGAGAARGLTSRPRRRAAPSEAAEHDPRSDADDPDDARSRAADEPTAPRACGSSAPRRRPRPSSAATSRRGAAATSRATATGRRPPPDDGPARRCASRSTPAPTPTRIERPPVQPPPDPVDRSGRPPADEPPTGAAHAAKRRPPRLDRAGDGRGRRGSSARRPTADDLDAWSSFATSGAAVARRRRPTGATTPTSGRAGPRRRAGSARSTIPSPSHRRRVLRVRRSRRAGRQRPARRRPGPNWRRTSRTGRLVRPTTSARRSWSRCPPTSATPRRTPRRGVPTDATRSTSAARTRGRPRRGAPAGYDDGDAVGEPLAGAVHERRAPTATGGPASTTGADRRAAPAAGPPRRAADRRAVGDATQRAARPDRRSCWRSSPCAVRSGPARGRHGRSSWRSCFAAVEFFDAPAPGRLPAGHAARPRRLPSACPLAAYWRGRGGVPARALPAGRLRAALVPRSAPAASAPVVEASASPCSASSASAVLGSFAALILRAPRRHRPAAGRPSLAAVAYDVGGVLRRPQRRATDRCRAASPNKTVEGLRRRHASLRVVVAVLVVGLVELGPWDTLGARRSLLGVVVRRRRPARRPVRVDAQARPRRQGHGHDPARPRRRARPLRRPAVRAARRLLRWSSTVGHPDVGPTRLGHDHAPVALAGSTGSIGTQTLDVVARRARPLRGRRPRRQRPRRSTCWSPRPRSCGPKVVAVADAAAAAELEAAAAARHRGAGRRRGAGQPRPPRPTSCVNGVVGFAGLPVTLAALEAGKRLALANKESLIAGRPGRAAGPSHAGRRARARRQRALRRPPVPAGRRRPDAGRPASCSPPAAGPFRGRTRGRAGRASPIDDALAHPTWKMGPKITVDSSTLMNKGLEVIEAHELFGVDFDQIEVVVHPQSIVHSMVEFTDGATIAQLSLPDMRLPIGYALACPDRLRRRRSARIDWTDARPPRLRAARPRRLPLPRPRLRGRPGRRDGAGLAERRQRGRGRGLPRRAHPVDRRSPTSSTRPSTGMMERPPTSVDAVIDADRRARERRRRRVIERRATPHERPPDTGPLDEPTPPTRRRRRRHGAPAPREQRQRRVAARLLLVAAAGARRRRRRGRPLLDRRRRHRRDDLPARARPLPHGQAGRHEGHRVLPRLRAAALVVPAGRDRVRRQGDPRRRLRAHHRDEQPRGGRPRGRGPHLPPEAASGSRLSVAVAGSAMHFLHRARAASSSALVVVGAARRHARSDGQDDLAVGDVVTAAAPPSAGLAAGRPDRRRRRQAVTTRRSSPISGPSCTSTGRDRRRRRRARRRAIRRRHAHARRPTTGDDRLLPRRRAGRPPRAAARPDRRRRSDARASSVSVTPAVGRRARHGSSRRAASSTSPARSLNASDEHQAATTDRRARRRQRPSTDGRRATGRCRSSASSRIGARRRPATARSTFLAASSPDQHLHRHVQPGAAAAVRRRPRRRSRPTSGSASGAQRPALPRRRRASCCRSPTPWCCVLVLLVRLVDSTSTSSTRSA